jgi:hypothetical protein
MTAEQVEELGPAFAEYLEPFLLCCDYTQTFDILGVYCRGLHSDLPRKTAAPPTPLLSFSTPGSQNRSATTTRRRRRPRRPW